MNSPIKVAVTGAAGQIGYSLVFRIASGEIFGPDQPLTLHLIEIPNALGALDGVVMELHDCAFPLLESIVPTADLDEGFRDINWALLVGSIPRKAGMERKDLLGINGKIFIGQGQAIERNAAADVRVLVIGNPCNTNCLIAMNNARGHSYAGSAANAIIDTMRFLTNDTPPEDWHSVAVCSDGSYDVEEGLISSFPVRVRSGKWEIVEKVPINDFSRDKIDKSVAELKEEKSLVSDLL